MESRRHLSAVTRRYVDASPSRCNWDADNDGSNNADNERSLRPSPTGKLKKAAVDGVPPAAAEKPSGLEEPAITLSSDDRPPQRVQQLDVPDVALHFLKFEAEIDGKNTSCLFDTGAILTVLKRNCFSPPTPTVSKLKLKGVLPGTGKLYGPRMATMKLNSHTYSFPVYEADMEEECIIGLNFIQSFYCVVDPVHFKLRINEPHQIEVSLQKATKSWRTMEITEVRKSNGVRTERNECEKELTNGAIKTTHTTGKQR